MLNQPIDWKPEYPAYHSAAGWEFEKELARKAIAEKFADKPSLIDVELAKNQVGIAIDKLDKLELDPIFTDAHMFDMKHNQDSTLSKIAETLKSLKELQTKLNQAA